jgi:hypothetical protein
MLKFHFSRLALTTFLLVSFPLASFAQFNDDGNETGYSDPEADAERSNSPPSARAAPVATNKTVIASLQAATSYCTRLVQSEFVIDCLSERLNTLAKQLEGQEGFEDVQAILETTARDLNQIARQNRSSTIAPATFTTSGETPVRTTRRLIPVDEAKMEDAVAQALAIIEETETLLLRSADDSTNRSIQFQQIAAAIGSNKVLLRSL